MKFLSHSLVSKIWLVKSLNGNAWKSGIRFMSQRCRVRSGLFSWTQGGLVFVFYCRIMSFVVEILNIWMPIAKERDKTDKRKSKNYWILIIYLEYNSKSYFNMFLSRDNSPPYLLYWGYYNTLLEILEGLAKFYKCRTQVWSWRKNVQGFRLLLTHAKWPVCDSQCWN